MSLDLQKLALRRLLEGKSSDFYSKLNASYFTGANKALYNKIQSFYKLNIKIPSIDEFDIIKKDVALQDYFDSEIMSESNKYDLVGDEFLLSQLQDYYIREETINFLDKFLDELSELEKIEIIDKLQNHLLSLNRAVPDNDELFDVADLDFFPKDGDFTLFPSELSAEYDAINGGFSLEELVLLGGRRGSGKSIISLNLALKRFLQGNTVAFFTIEMRYKEVYSRLLSILSKVPFLTIFKNEVSDIQKLAIVRAKLDTFYESNSVLEDWYNKLIETKNFKEFERKFKNEKPTFKRNRFFLIDDEGLTLNRFDHYCNRFSNEYDNFNLSVVDYLNIMKHPDAKDWKSQIVLSEGLKSSSRRYKQTVISPYQIDATGEARFAKGILDSADRSFIFFPAEENEQRQLANTIKIHTSKIRNGKHMSFEVPMNWDCVSIDSAQSHTISERPHKIAMFGDDETTKNKESSRDV